MASHSCDRKRHYPFPLHLLANILMAAGIELPKQVIVHSHWLCDGFKMSKSLGNVVDQWKLVSIMVSTQCGFPC